MSTNRLHQRKAMIALAAVSKNNVIGLQNKIPWKRKEDMRWFKRFTMDKTIVMGRVTYENMPVLSGRRLIVFSRNKDIQVNENWPAAVVSDYREIPEDAIVCGGAQTYSHLLWHCSELYLTEIDQEVEGDTYMPAYKFKYRKWEVLESGDQYRIVRYFN